MRRATERKLNDLVVVLTLVVLVAAIFWASVLPWWRRHNGSCSAFRNYTVREVPARCLTYFEKGGVAR